MKNPRIIWLLTAALLISGCGGAKQTAAGEEAPETEEAVSEGVIPEEEAAAEETAPETVFEEPSFELYEPDIVFTTTDRDGNTWDESVFADYELTMINFWEPWCGPCVREMPDLQKLQETYADRGLLILGVYSADNLENEVDEELSDAGVTYPILHYTGAFDAFQSGYVPTTVFVDKAGHVVFGGDGNLYIGSNSYEGWAAIIEGLL